MKIKFTKMHGLGNDFVVIDATQSEFTLTSQQIAMMANRHTGVGFDQLLLLQSATKAAADFTYRIFNADGGEVEQCGNGARCVAKFAVDSGLTHKRDLVLQTRNGDTLTSLVENGLVKVTLNEPKFYKHNPCHMQIDGREIIYYQVDVGNPHAVIFIEDENDIAFAQAMSEDRKRFPAGINVGLLRVKQADEISLTVLERGSGWTAACGSGACAAVAVGRQYANLSNRVLVSQRGGDLYITWNGKGEALMMEGPAVTVFCGEWFQ